MSAQHNTEENAVEPPEISAENSSKEPNLKKSSAEPQHGEGGEGGQGKETAQPPADETLAEWLSATSSENMPDPVPDPPGNAENSEPAGDAAADEPEPEEKSAASDTDSEDVAAQLAATRDQLLRKAADFENFRKRMNQEKQSAIEFANRSLLLDIIPIIDDFERAIISAQASEDLIALPAGKAMLEGITMIEKRLISQLESKWGLKRFNSAGELFDPTFHEAMFMEKSSDVEEAIVVEDFIKGYTLKDRVIRAAKVKVLVPEDSEQ